jgi:hypothetical protein
MGFQKINEILEKPDYKQILETVRYPENKKYYDFEEYNVFGTGYMQSGAIRDSYKVQPMGREDANVIAEMVKNTPFPMLAREFLAQSGTTGIGGAAYLVPTKIHSILQTYASPEDIINDVSASVIPASEIPGSTLDITIAKRNSYIPHPTTSGGVAPEEELGFTKATLNFTKTLTVNFNIGNDLLEDTPQLSLVETHIRMAGAEMGKRSTTEVLSVMSSTSDGDGTLNTVTASGDSTTFAQIAQACDKIIVDEFRPDRLLAMYHVMVDAIMADTTYFPSGSVSSYRDAIAKAQDPGLFGLQWIRCDHASLFTAGTHATSSATESPTNVISYVFCKDYSYISGRKRWMRIENYSDPVRDLAGAVISSRQDTVSIYDDSACKISES